MFLGITTGCNLNDTVSIPINPDQPVDLGDHKEIPAPCNELSAYSTFCSQKNNQCLVAIKSTQDCQTVCAYGRLVCEQSYGQIAEGTFCENEKKRPKLNCSNTNQQEVLCVCKEPIVCTPDCSTKQCGSDGCGGVCATCSNWQVCINGQCESSQQKIDCSSQSERERTLLLEREGFGAMTTGGKGGALYRVTTLTGSSVGSLPFALERPEPLWIVFDVDGVVKFPSSQPIDMKSNKTIDGRGAEITIDGGINLQDVQNIIITDVTITRTNNVSTCSDSHDILSIRGTGSNDEHTYTTQRIWINHVTLQTGGDALLDVRGGTNITISWSAFKNHVTPMLLWKDLKQQETSSMHITMHHNFFDQLTDRSPQFHFGKLHFYNNYNHHWYDNGVISLDNAQVYSESNIYRARQCVMCPPDSTMCSQSQSSTPSTYAIRAHLNGSISGQVKSVGDFLLDGAKVEEANSSSVFDPRTHYTYNAQQATETLASYIQNTSGPRGKTICQ